ncbi:hypothetical protein Tco_0105292 [Tanacetum coccineum]
MANIRTCNKHNMIACVEKTAQNADFYQIIDFLTGCSINYSLLVDPDLIGPWLQQFWATASLKVINDVPHIRAKVAGKKILISEATIRADLLFDDENGVDCFPKQVIWDTLRDIGYEGNLAQLTFSKPLFSPQWKYLVHVLLHCLSPKSTSWEQFGTNIASALVGLATNQKFNFSLMILTGMLGHISNGTPFLMYPRFVQLFLNKQLEGVDRPQDFIPSVSLPSKVFTFMRKHSTKFSCRITPLTPSMLEYSPHWAGRKTSIASIMVLVNSQGTADIQRTADFQGTAEPHDAASIPKSPNDYTPTDVFQTSGGDEGLLDIYALNRETTQRLARQGTITPRTLNFEDEAGPSSPLRPIQGMDSEEQHNAAEVLVSISRPRGSASIKDTFKDFIPLDSRKKGGCSKERDAKKTLRRKRKATYLKNSHQKNLSFRNKTIDELRNYFKGCRL